MNKCAPLIVLISAINCLFPAAVFCAGVSDVSDVSVKVIASCGDEGFGMRGPMKILVHIYNCGKDAITYLSNYSKVDCISVQVSGAAGESLSTPARHDSGRQLRLSIDPGGEIAFPVFLNNFYAFSAPGTARVSWIVNFPIVVSNSIKTVKASGDFTVNIREAVKDALEHELSRLFDSAVSTEDPIVKMEIVEAICSVRDVSVIPYLRRLLNVREGEFRSIETLTQVWNGDQEAEKAIDKYIEATSNADGLRLIIGIFQEKRRLLTDAQLSRLLKFPNADVRFCGILYIRGIIAKLHLEDIAPLSKDPNPGIVEQSDEILKAFAEVLRKNESKSFKKQAAEQASANGF